MAKARAIVKRRKAVRNIRKITKTMQMIATVNFQKALKRAVGTKPYTNKVRELVAELAATVGNVQHPLLRQPGDDRTNRVALVVITSNRGLAGAYNGSVLRTAVAFIRQQEAAGKSVDLYVAGKKGISYFNYQRRPIVECYNDLTDAPRFVDVERVAERFMSQFTGRPVGTLSNSDALDLPNQAPKLDSVHVAYMNFVSTGVQKPEVMTLLPLSAVSPAPRQDAYEGALRPQITYDFYPSAKELLDDLLPRTVKTALFQCFLDAVTSENVARMVAMKSATDNADKMVKSLTMQYNRARQSQITTELSEIMGGVEAMKS